MSKLTPCSLNSIWLVGPRVDLSSCRYVCQRLAFWITSVDAHTHTTVDRGKGRFCSCHFEGPTGIEPLQCFSEINAVWRIPIECLNEQRVISANVNIASFSDRNQKAEERWG